MGEYRVLGDPGIVGMLCFLSFLVLIATAVNAVFLRAAIAFYNWMAKVVGSPTPIEEPPLRVATTINLVPAVLHLVASPLIMLLANRVSDAVGEKLDTDRALLVCQLGILAITCVVMTVMLRTLLPTTYVRAIVVTFIWVLIAAVFGGGTIFVMSKVMAH